ncbi:hypothetical protein [Streptomyces sp. NPDC048641]|uniref:hypothetical protein n=1 Tax=Streptomyces sp. NPDC048641 TaxID=3154825 RepID=UPI0034265EB3
MWNRIRSGLLVVLLPGLVVAEYVALKQQQPLQHAAALASGLVVCVCAVPVPQVRLEGRAAGAAVVTLATTVGLLVAGHPVRVWGLGESIALLFLLSPILWRSAVRTAAQLCRFLEWRRYPVPLLISSRPISPRPRRR